MLLVDTDAQSRQMLPSLTAEPIARPIMTQRWADVVFLHWRYEPEVVQRLLPPGIQVDVHDGSAWVALVPFGMQRIGLPGLPPVPFVGSFPEVNVRTYVRSGERRGVWFFSLDIDLRLPTAVARVGYGLPYCYGIAEHVRTDGVLTTRVDRRWPRPASPAVAEIAVATAGPLDDDGDLTHFLTSRWGLFTTSRRGKIRYAPVDHEPWPLFGGEVLYLQENLLASTGLPAPTVDPHVMWSTGVDVRVGLPHRATKPLRVDRRP